TCRHRTIHAMARGLWAYFLRPPELLCRRYRWAGEGILLSTPGDRHVCRCADDFQRSFRACSATAVWSEASVSHSRRPLRYGFRAAREADKSIATLRHGRGVSGGPNTIALPGLRALPLGLPVRLGHADGRDAGGNSADHDYAIRVRGVCSGL